MQPGLPFDFPALLNSADALIRDPGFWWEVGVLLLAAAGAWMVHRTLGEGLATRTEGGEDYTVRYLALKTLQRVIFPISMLLGVLAGRVLLQHHDSPVQLLELAVPLLVSLATIRIIIIFPAQDLPPRSGGESLGKSHRHFHLDRRRAVSSGLAAS